MVMVVVQGAEESEPASPVCSGAEEEAAAEVAAVEVAAAEVAAGEEAAAEVAAAEEAAAEEAGLGVEPEEPEEAPPE